MYHMRSGGHLDEEMKKGPGAVVARALVSSIHPTTGYHPGDPRAHVIDLDLWLFVYSSPLLPNASCPLILPPL